MPARVQNQEAVDHAFHDRPGAVTLFFQALQDPLDVGGHGIQRGGEVSEFIPRRDREARGHLAAGDPTGETNHHVKLPCNPPRPQDGDAGGEEERERRDNQEVAAEPLESVRHLAQRDGETKDQRTAACRGNAPGVVEEIAVHAPAGAHRLAGSRD